MRDSAMMEGALALMLGVGLGLTACGDSSSTGGGDTIGADTLVSSDILVPSDTIAMPDTVVPQDTVIPQDTVVPQDTVIPQDTVVPQDTVIPQDTVVPQDTVIPQDTTVTDTSVTDTTVTDTTEADTTVADTTVADTTVADTTGPTCGPLALSGDLVHVDGYSLYQVIGDFGVGDSAIPDVLSIEFYVDAAGTFDLASGNNANYATCDQCVLVYADYDETSGDAAATYFQTGGTLTVPAATPPGSAEFSATLTNLALTEVTIEVGTYTSTPVAGGACLEASGVTTLSTGAPAECGPLTVTGTLAQYQTDPIYVLEGEFAGDSTIPDLMAIEFYTSDTGTFDLASADNANYETCAQCVVVYADVDATTGAAATYFQTGGTLLVDAGTAPGGAEMNLSLTDLGIEEVTIDGTTFVSTPVAGGACYEMTGTASLTTGAAVECSALTLAGELAQYQTESIYEVLADFGVGGAAPDLLSLEFYTSDTGSFDLASADNANYETCAQCVLIYADYDETNGPSAIFFQSGGTLAVDAATAPGGADLTATLTDLSLVEVTIDGTTFASTPVAGGACYETTGATTLMTGAAGPTCGPITVSGDLAKNPDYDVYQVMGDFGAGDATPDILSIEYYAADTGSFDLGAGANANYSTCTQCVVLYADYDETNGPAAVFFQTGGAMLVDPMTPPGGEDFGVTLTGVGLEEVTIDTTSYVSTPVADGACYELAGPTTLIATAPECVPNCGAHICGPDGCGGVCGEDCASGGTCNLDGAACETTPTCLQVTVGGPELVFVNAGLFGVEFTSVEAGAVDLSDWLQIEFYADAAGTFDLGDTANSNYATCSQCVRAFVDIEADDTRQFFQTAGTMVVDGSSNIGTGPVQIGFTGLHLVEVTVAPGPDFTSTPVAGGACIDVVVSPDLTTP